jgi:hypothetical protein
VGPAATVGLPQDGDVDLPTMDDVLDENMIVVARGYA